jgi:RimJ/RimL family protein N-acetyltransferase
VTDVGAPRLLPDAERLPDVPTSRLVLRALGPDDVPALFAIFGDAEVCRYWSRPPLPDLAAAAALQAEIARHFAERTLFQWGIAERAGGRIVGTCTLAALSPEHRRAEVGYALARAAWGRGYAAEALPALVRFAFTALDLHRLEADVDPRNAPSVRSLERAGFAREGHLRERWFQQGEWQDAALYGLLRADWDARVRADRRRG